MIDLAIDYLPNRLHEWLKGQVQSGSGSVVEGAFNLVESAEACPNPASLDEARAWFPALVVTGDRWKMGELANALARGEVEGQHELAIHLFRVADDEEKIGPQIRALANKVAKLFSSTPRLRPPATFWRTEDVAATGFSLYHLYPFDAGPGAPVRTANKFLIESYSIQLLALGSSSAI